VEVRPLTNAAAGALFPRRIAVTFAGSLAAIGLLIVLTVVYSSVSYAARHWSGRSLGSRTGSCRGGPFPGALPTVH
jgi:hypothetical protein